MVWGNRHDELLRAGFKFVKSGSCDCNDFYHYEGHIIQKSRCKNGGTKRHIRCPWVGYLTENNKRAERPAQYVIDVVRKRRDIS